MLCWCCSTTAHGATVTLTVDDLSAAIAQSDGEPDAISRLLLDEIEQHFDEAGLRLESGDPRVQ